MNFQESLTYLYGLGYELSVKKFGLENTIALLDSLNNPETNYLKVQVAGTNGKGSTCAFLESICIEAGIRVGKFTSPHLVSITERICIDGKPISEKDFADYASNIREVSLRLVETGKLAALPTFFEHLTAMTILAFAERDIELAILETGLGGRFDATTAARADLVAITPIHFDHQNILGNTLEEIASEKAAIIRGDTRVLIAPQQNEARIVISDKCVAVGAVPMWVEPRVRSDADGGSVSFQTDIATYGSNLKMRGKHQWINASLAIQIAESLREFGFDISRADIETGLEDARHAGRLELFENVLFDGAHNVAGATALREYLDEFIKRPITMIFGAMQEKDLTEIAQILFPVAETLILTKPDNPRAMELDEMSKFVSPDFDPENVYRSESVEHALSLATEKNARNGIILVTGSLYLVGEIRGMLMGNVGNK